MSKKDVKASEMEQDDRPSDSVFDFLYCDTPRIGSFLAQFDDSGHLKSLTQHESAALGIKRGFKLALGGGATLVGQGGSANIAFERGPAEEGSEGADRVYDPLWTNARTFLDFIYDRKMIRDVKEASLGHFVLVSGSLSIVDVSLMKHILDKPVLKRKLSDEMETSSTPTNRQQRRAAAKASSLSDHEVGFELLPIFPLTAQATMTSGKNLVWSTLSPSSLTVQAGDLLLQHGVNIPGTWHMLAILDSKPDAEFPDAEVEHRLLPIAAGVAGLVPAMRQLLGRPPSAHGVTPLLIFRDVSG